MFRELKRKNKSLDECECKRLLTEIKRGVLSVNGDDGYPYGMPMNHYFCEDDGCIYFHCGRVGHRLDSLDKSDKVSFCVLDGGTRAEVEWALTVKSVIVFGRMEIIDDVSRVTDIARRLSHKFTHDEAYISGEIEKFARATLLLKLTPEHICGKVVSES